jgi:hypothetical protein
MGLTVTTYKGQRQVAHGGSTAGYQTYLTRFPDARLSVAVMCNSSASNPSVLAYRVVDAAIGPLPDAAAPDTVTIPVADLQSRVGLWRGAMTHLPLQTTIESGTIRVVNGPLLRATRDGSFIASGGQVRWRFTPAAGGPARAVRSTADGEEQFVAETPWTPTAADLAKFAGDWWADEAGALFTVAVENDRFLVLKQRPDTRMVLRPLYRDHFAPVQGSGQVLWFTRDTGGRVTGMHIGMGRLRDMPFVRH